MNLSKIFSKLINFILHVLCFRYSYSTESPLLFDETNHKFSMLPSIQIEETILSSHPYINEEYHSNILSITKYLELDKPYYLRLFFLLKRLYKEIYQQTPCIDWGKIDFILPNEFFKFKKKLNLNGKDHELYNLFDKLLIKKLDYDHEKILFKDYTMLYNLQGKYSITKETDSAGNINLYKLFINVAPYPRYTIKTNLAKINVTFIFIKSYDSLKEEPFKLQKIIINTPHPLKETEINNLLQNQYPEHYKQRNSLKTSLSFEFL